MTVNLASIQQAHKRITPYLAHTPLIRFQALEEHLDTPHPIYLKCEHHQPTHTFKVRGAFNALLSLKQEERQKGIVTRSSGNFAQAVAYAAQKLSMHAKIVMPLDAPLIKQERTKQFHPELILFGKTHEEGEEKVEEMKQELGCVALSPYDQKEVIEGQGTAALEIYEALPSIAHFFCPIGGGGLMSGCATAFKSLNASIQTIGIEPKGAQDYCLARQKGERFALKEIETIADGLRASQVGVLNWPLLQEHVDLVEVVSDAQIQFAMAFIYRALNIVTEPSGAVSLAALLFSKIALKGPAVCLLSGANIDSTNFHQLISKN
ncbi:threonine dehydratase [Candidatus Protochlamydia naegleriophila]|uniref:Threonine dehydratase n=1 Tax=Candidatus Protochlamydia naegleriophila TaxID=389348 RepID=A0A0U5CNC3_9BACT|nr:threonine/serine dehydratase [Candidatus Protochlamydia naegleriophila]CUI16140.1 threonine dehydratase [Candidatus Protochlamydia naegleriophila]